MKKVMIIGAVRAGKSTLIKALFGESEPSTKTQSLIYRDWIIDTPGEYSENPLYYRSLIATSHETAAVVLVQDATRNRNYFPPGFEQGFPMLTLGVVTKIDHPKADIDRAISLLRQSLPEGEIFLTSAASTEGIQKLKERLMEIVKD
ncbi:EutP/PduV family microcompartment system protein [Paenibacillus alginolyticus]|uniref:EutP/PduV family microcompartment system protein n=1 Tax=Paenibacillus alginolyticus TaxID=59839 RepID=A0ABT4GNI0_9BACL|nr:EutP/PduV family microcompartment system protein [Paenibacillus alginolyticus]MCY9697641.1 EutP/PduV family microcompartment system protein [Paenibacillus alginolyticus]MEC0148353.1 EutP/PduV family microcompartment system protein [Paenibacillus alginolyticus]